MVTVVTMIVERSHNELMLGRPTSVRQLFFGVTAVKEATSVAPLNSGIRTSRRINYQLLMRK
jgi:hypothetical protein